MTTWRVTSDMGHPGQSYYTGYICCNHIDDVMSNVKGRVECGFKRVIVEVVDPTIPATIQATRPTTQPTAATPPPPLNITINNTFGPSHSACPNDLKALLNHINILDTKIQQVMSAISDYANRVNTAFDTLGGQVDGLVTSLAGITADVQFLKDTIAAIQASSGAISPADQALLDALEARTGALVSKVQGASNTAATLDAATEEAPAPAPTA